MTTEEIKNASIQDLGGKIADLKAEVNAIKNLAKSADRDVTDEEAALVNAHAETVKAIKAEIETRQSRQQAFADFDSVSQMDTSTDNTPASKPEISVNAPNFTNDPKKGFKTPREFLQAVQSHDAFGKRDERLDYLQAVGSDEHTGANDPYGGFLVPEAYSTDIRTTNADVDPLAALTNKITMDKPIVNIPARVDKNHSTSVSGGLTVRRRNETDEASASRVKTENIRMEATGQIGLAFATDELMTDAPGTFMSLISNGFQDEFASALAEERIDGTGVGQYEGLLNSPALVTVAKESSQTADTIVYENIIKMFARCWRASQAVWLANHDTLPQLMQLKQTVGDAGVPAWQPSAREGAPATLLGRPLYTTEYCKTVGDKGDLILVNPTQYLEGNYQPLESAESIHVRFLNNERAFRFTQRNAGAGWWRSVLTPKNGSTLSPFVTLAARA